MHANIIFPNVKFTASFGALLSFKKLLADWIRIDFITFFKDFLSQQLL
jgi:hypothetical protein